MRIRIAAAILSAAALAATPGAVRAHGEAVGPEHFGCFNNDTGKDAWLRVEWPEEKRHAVFSWPVGKRLKVLIDHGEANWCWDHDAAKVQAACVRQTKVDKGCV
jgi:hypothetical protein